MRPRLNIFRRLCAVCLICGFCAFCSICVFCAHASVVDVGNFSNLNVVANVNVDYRCVPDSAGLVVLDCDRATADLFILKNNTKGKLTIQLSSDAIGMTGLPTVRVYSSRLIQAENAGDSTLTIHAPQHEPKVTLTMSDNGRIVAHDLDADELSLRIITGRGTITAAGTASTTLKLRNVGTGVIDATAVTAPAIKCRILGTGSVRCNAAGATLSIKGAGTGKVYYHGTPATINVRKLGSIRAIPLD